MAQAFQIGDWRVDPAAGCISRTTGSVALRPREMDLLVFLASQNGEVVTADQLLEHVWQGVVVGTDSVYFTISQLRKALEDEKDAPRYIETIPKRGYRLIATVSAIEPTAASTPDNSRSRMAVIAAGLALVALATLTYLTQRPQPAPAPAVAESTIAIAVMPFIDLSPDQDQGYFSDGVAEELRNYLARMPGLRIASREPSLAVRAGELETREIGERLNVSKLIEGSVRRDNNRVRIAAQLVDATNGFQLWSQTFEQPLSNILVVQDQISRAIAGALQLQLLEASAPVSRTTDPRAYDLYLQALLGVRTNSYTSLRTAAAQLTEAIALDPEFAEAHAALALTRHLLHATGADTSAQALADAEQFANKALQLDPASARAHVALGRIASARGEGTSANQHLQRAIELAPGNGEILVERAKMLAHHGDFKLAAELFERALVIDPLNSKVHSAYANYLESLGDTNRAISAFQQAITLNPRDPNLQWFISKAETARGNLAAAAQALEIAVDLDPLDYEIAAHLAMAYTDLGLQEAAANWTERAIRLGPDSLLAHAARARLLRATGERALSIEFASTLLADSELRDSHSASGILRILVARELLILGDSEAARRTLLANDNLSRYLAGPRATSYFEFRRLKIDPTELLTLAAIYQQEEQLEKLQTALAHLEPVSLDRVLEFRDRARPADLLVEAQLQALNNNLPVALERLSEAGSASFQSLEDLQAFGKIYGVTETQVFTELRNDIERSRDAQRQQALALLTST